MEAIAAAASVVGLVSSIARVATTLNNLQQRYSLAALNIAFITSSLWTTKAALEAIGAWRATSTDTSESSQQLDVDLEVSLQSCALLVAIIERKLVEMKLDQPTFMDKARFLALDAIYKDYASNLDAQIRALHLLLTIFQCRTSTEQKARLENQQTRTVFRRVLDSTASLRLVEDQDLQDAVSILSEDPSVNLSVDAILLNTPLYRKVYKKRSSYYYAQPAATPRQIPRKPIGHTKSNSTGSVSRHSVERPVDPFLAENSQLPFLGIPFVGEPSVPIFEEDADVDEDVEEKEPAVEETGLGAASAEPTRESDIIEEAPTSGDPPGQNIVDPEPSHTTGSVDMSATPPCKVEALEKKRVKYESPREQHLRAKAKSGQLNRQQGLEKMEVAPAPAPNFRNGQHASEEPLTDPTSRLKDAGEDSHFSSTSSRARVPSIKSAKSTVPSILMERQGIEMASVSAQEKGEKQLPFDLRSISTGELDGTSHNDLPGNSTASVNIKITPFGSDKGNYENAEAFNINFGPSPSLDIPDLQSSNPTDDGGKPRMILPNIKIEDIDNSSSSHGLSDGNPPEKLGRNVPSSPTRPPPPIPITASKPNAAAGQDSLGRDMGSQSLRTPGSVGDDDTEAGTTLPVLSSQSSSGSLSGYFAASTPDTLLPSTHMSLEPTLAPPNLEQVGVDIRRRRSEEAAIKPTAIKPKASRQFTKEAIFKSISAIQRTYLPEPTKGTPGPRKFPRFSIGGHSKQSGTPSAVYAAAATGNSEYLVQLLEDNAKLVNTTTDQKCSNGLFQPRTPLMCAAIGGHLDCIDVLRSFGADARISDKQGKTALHLAVEAGQLGAVTSLLRPALNVGISRPRPLSTNDASDIGGSKALPTISKRAISEAKRTPINTRASLEAADSSGRTPLHCAVIERSDTIVSALVANGAVIDALDANKETPLVWAVKLNDPSSIFTLTEAGANVKHRDINGESVLFHAARLGHLNIIEMLSPQQADLESRNSSGERPLHVACTHDRNDVVTALLEKGIDVNSWTEPSASKQKMSIPRPARGQKRELSLPLPCTPLHLACVNGHYDSSLILMTHGAWVNATLEDTRTPLMLAVDSGNAQLVSLLLAHGAKVNATTSKECLTALHLACRNGNLDITKMLVNHGANTFALTRGSNPETPPFHALSSHNNFMPMGQRAAVNYVIEINRAHARQRAGGSSGPSRLPDDEASYSSGYGVPPSTGDFHAGLQPPPPTYAQSTSNSANKSQFK